MSWIWDRVHQTGLRAAVVGWPGIVHAYGSKVPMASAASLSVGQGVNGKWPLASPLVYSESVRADVAAARVSTGEITDDELSSLSESEDDTSEQMQRYRENVRVTLANAKSTGRVLEKLAVGGVDFAALSMTLGYTNQKWSQSIAVAVVDSMIDGVLRAMGPDTLILVTSFYGQRGQLVVLSPPGEKKKLDSSNKELNILDVAPTTLALLGLDSPEYCAGRNLLQPENERSPAFNMPAQVEVREGESLMLLEMIERGELESLAVRRQVTLKKFLTQRLSEEWVEARARFDFRDCVRVAEMMVRFDANENSLWRLAFACQCTGESEGVSDASQRLLEAFPGSAGALLSGLLGSSSTNREDIRAIVDAVDPSSLPLPSMRSTWGRAAIGAGRPEEGLTVLERVIERGFPLLIDCVIAATTARSGGDNAKALKLLGRVGGGKAAPLNWRILRAQLLLANGRNDEARDLANKILEAFPFESRAKTILERAEGSVPPTS